MASHCQDSQPAVSSRLVPTSLDKPIDSWRQHELALAPTSQEVGAFAFPQLILYSGSMNQTHAMWYRIIAIVIVILVGAAALFLLLRKQPQSPAATNATSTPTTQSTSTPKQKTVSGVTGTGNFTVELVPNVKLPRAPDFRMPIAFSSDIAAEVKTQIQNNSNILIDRIAKNANDMRSWIDLGTMHKMAGDYKGAETFWVYVTKAAPKNSIAFQNLGDLYKGFLVDYPKAESSYLTAIKIDPADTNPYRALFELYTIAYKKGTSAAEDILKQGISVNSQSVDLQVVLARYYKSLGRTQDAKVEYDLAIQNAKSQGQNALASQIEQETRQ